MPMSEQEGETTACPQRKRMRSEFDDIVIKTEISDVESPHSEVDGLIQSQQTPVKKRTSDASHVSIEPEVEDHLAEWIQSNPLFYDKCDREFKDTAKKNRLMETKGSEFGLTGANLQLWYRNMRTVYTRHVNGKSRNRPGSRLTARQLWTLQNFAFLKDHISTKFRSNGQVLNSTQEVVPQEAVPQEEEGESDDEAGSSVSESPVTGSQSAAAKLNSNDTKKGKRTTVEDQLSSILANIASNKSEIQELHHQNNNNKLRQLFCQYLTAEVELLTEDQFYSFQNECMTMMTMFRQERGSRTFQQVLHM